MKKKTAVLTHKVGAELFHHRPDLPSFYCISNLLIQIINLDKNMLGGQVGGGREFHR